jgi:hypothetical protein
MEELLAGVCPCFAPLLRSWAAQRRAKEQRAMMIAGIDCTRRSARFASFGSRSEKVTVRLSSQSDTVLQFKVLKDGAPDPEAALLEGSSDWHEVDLTSVKLVEKKGEQHDL